MASADTGYVPRSQAAFKFAGHISGPTPPKRCAAGRPAQRDWEDTILAVQPYAWLYFDDRLGCPGPCWVTADPAAVAV